MTTIDSELEGDLSNPEFQLRDGVKLVIWDLDETFWTGTLSEGPVEIAEANAEVIRELNRRGIVSAICSKNDFEAVKERLSSEEDLWAQFVFPRIGWTPKGQTIAQLIEDIQLRPPNVLFIDDNVGNLREAEHYASGLQTAGPEIIPYLLALPQLVGKDDRELSRLNQYRQLEAKLADRDRSTVSNEEFLMSCDIRVEISKDCGSERERVLELVNRTNQLNYTKRRLTEAELDALLMEPGRESGYITVRDRYGEYGLCGFYSMKDGALDDFAFSCRILHMGVETWLYQHLGRPALEVVGDVATELEPDAEITWINAAASSAHASNGDSSSAVQAKVLLKGGCDLVQVDDFLAGSLKTELSYTNDRGSYVEFHHIEVIRRSNAETLAQFGEVIDRLPFISRSEYRTKALDPSVDVTHIALSLLNEYGQGLYRLRGSDFVVPYGQYYVDITKPENWAGLAENGLDDAFLEWFSESFEFCGAVTLDRFQENIRWLAQALPSGRTLLLINGAEVDLGSDDPAVSDLHLHQRRYNLALDALASELPNVRIVDVREFIRTPEDVTFNTRHYTRRAYLGIAEGLRVQSESGLRVVERHPLASFGHRSLRLVRAPGLRARVLRALRTLSGRIGRQAPLPKR